MRAVVVSVRADDLVVVVGLGAVDGGGEDLEYIINEKQKGHGGVGGVGIGDVHSPYNPKHQVPNSPRYSP